MEINFAIDFFISWERVIFTTLKQESNCRRTRRTVLKCCLCRRFKTVADIPQGLIYPFFCPEIHSEGFDGEECAVRRGRYRQTGSVVRSGMENKAAMTCCVVAVCHSE